ncbi:MAG: hypothetical protein JO023_01960 [Chloroflexi bacterium]|nr:hypothetical protein [Chloroflexota bacterium]
MLSIPSIPVAEKSDLATAISPQDRPENMAVSLVDDTRAMAPVDDRVARDDVEGPVINQVDDAAEATSAASPATEALAARLQALLGAVLEVEQLSRRAREAAASDLAHYDALVTAAQVLEHHQLEAAGIRQRAEQLAASAFGQQARAVAASTLAEARVLEQALGDLVAQRAAEAAAFQAEHPDVEALVEERREQAAEARQHQLEAERAERLTDLLRAGELALRQGALGEAQECLRRLEAEFPAEGERIAALRARLHQRAQAGRDTVARAALGQAAEHQGRGDLEAAVTVLEQVEVRGLSAEVGEDVFGAWSQACSRLAQSAGFDEGPAGSPHEALVRFAPTKGRGLILMRDPAVPHGLVVFSALGMGAGYPRDKIVSDRLIVERARGFRRAVPLADVGSTGQSYASWPNRAADGVERH